MCGSSGMKPSLSVALIFGAGMKENGNRDIEKSKMGTTNAQTTTFYRPVNFQLYLDK
jgi:hypothetical protein